MPPAALPAEFAPSAWLDFYRRDLKSALGAASNDGFQVVEPNTAGSEFDPDQFGASARRHFGRYLESLGIRLGGLSLVYPGRGLSEPEQAERRLQRLKQTLDLCVGLGVQTATVNLDGLDDQRTSPLATDILAAAADQADRAGVRLAVLGGRDDPRRTIEAIEALRCPALGVALDTGRTPRPDFLTLGQGAIAAVQLRDVRPAGEGYEDVEFGAGEVDFSGWLEQLRGHAYHGQLTVRRASGTADVDALRRAREYLDARLRGSR